MEEQIYDEYNFELRERVDREEKEDDRIKF